MRECVDDQMRGPLLPVNFGKPVSMFMRAARSAMRLRAAGAATSRGAAGRIGRGTSCATARIRARARASAGVFGGSEEAVGNGAGGTGDGVGGTGDGAGGTSGAAAAARGW